jgi:hypothetical protein
VFVDATYIGTLSANNASYLGGTAAAGYQTTAGLAANVATLTSNNATYAFGKTEGALNVNSALTSNSTTYLGGNTASDLNTYADNKAANAYSNAIAYSGNAAQAYTNAVSYVDGKSYVNTSQLSSNLSNYQTTAGLASNVATLTSNNATYAFGKTEGALNVNSALTSNNSTYAFGKSESALNVNSALTSNNSTYAFGKSESGLNVNSALTSNNSTYAFDKTEGNLNVNSALTSNNSTYAFGKSESALNVNSALTANNSNNLGGVAASGYQTTAGLASNVATLAANSATYVLANNGIVSNASGVFVNGNTGLVVNATGVHVNSTYIGTLSANNASYLGGTIASGYQTTAGLAANVATLAANSATYLGSSINSGNSTGIYSTGTISASGIVSGLELTSTLASGDEGGQINLTKPPNGTLDGGITIDAYQNRVRIFEQGGSARGAYIDLTGCAAGVGTNLLGGAGSGTVTSVGSGNGLTGGPITGAGTLSVLANNGIVANSTGVFVNGNTGLVVNSTGVHVNSTYIGTLTANNATNLGGVAAASYVQNTDSRTLSGNLAFSGANNTFSGNLTISATGELIIAAGAGIYANGGLGTAGQVLTSNASSVYWSTISAGGGATLSNETASATTHYPAMSTTSSGTWSSAIVSTTKLYFTPSTGQLNATIFNSLSDAKVKKDIVTFTNALGVIDNIRGVRYNWIDNGKPSIGVIAQEIEKYLPELVSKSPEGEMSVNYGGLVGVLIEAIKELIERINKLEGK